MITNIKKLINQASTGNYTSHGTIKDGDCVIGFSFGFRKEGNKKTPGLSNEDLARFIEKKLYNKPLILQFEINNALNLQTDQPIYKIKKHRVKDQYLSTDEVALQAIEIMKKNNWKKAIIIAHPYHMPRVDAICKQLKIKTIAPKGLKSVRFDPLSSQEWTRNKHDWIKREVGSIQFYNDRKLI